MTSVVTRDETGSVPKVPKKKASEVVADKTASPTTRRIEALAKRRNLSGRALAAKVGLSPSALNKSFGRKSSSVSFDNAVLLARALAVSLDELASDAPAGFEIPFREFADWVHGTPGISKALAAHREISVGDLLRYRGSPSNQGEFDADAVWAQIQRLRKGLDISAGVDVTPDEAADVLTMPK